MVADLNRLGSLAKGVSLRCAVTPLFRLAKLKVGRDALVASAVIAGGSLHATALGGTVGSYIVEVNSSTDDLHIVEGEL